MSKKNTVSALMAGCAALLLSCWFITAELPLQAEPQVVNDAAGVSVDLNGARLMHRPPVNYPTELIAKGIQGTVVAQVKLDGSGDVVDASVVSGPDELRKTVLQSLLQWHFAGDSANGTRQVTIGFTAPKGTEAQATVQPQFVVSSKLAAGTRDVPIASINIMGLSDDQRDALLAKLPVHVGDKLTPELRNEVLRTIRAFDEHMTMGTMIKRGADEPALELRIMEPGPSLLPEAATPAATPKADVAAPPGAQRIGANVMAASLASKVDPVYPPLAEAARVQGTVVFQVTIGTDGTVQNIQLISGPPLLVQAAMTAVKQWTYKPTLLNGQPVTVVTTVSLDFTLP